MTVLSLEYQSRLASLSTRSFSTQSSDCALPRDGRMPKKKTAAFKTDPVVLGCVAIIAVVLAAVYASLYLFLFQRYQIVYL